MRKKNQKEELPESPECSEVCRISSKMKPTRAHGSAPRPGELHIPGGHFCKRSIKTLGLFCDSPFFLRNLVEALIVFPGAALAYLPLRNRFRTETRYLMPAVCAILFAVSAATAWFSSLFGVDNDVFVLLLVPLCFGLFCLTANAPLPEKVFCFLNAVIQVQYVTMYTVYLTAPWEDDASAFTVRSGLVCLGLGFCPSCCTITR